MEEQRSGRIIVHIDPDLQDLIPVYLNNRQKDMVALHEAVAKGDLDAVRILGHGMKGSGGGYGFPTITEIGSAIEKAAQEGREDRILEQIRRLEDYLQRIEMV